MEDVGRIREYVAERIRECFSKYKKNESLAALYLGNIDLETGLRLKRCEVDLKNINPRESVRPLIESYEYSARLSELIGIFLMFCDSNSRLQKSYEETKTSTDQYRQSLERVINKLIDIGNRE